MARRKPYTSAKYLRSQGVDCNKKPGEGDNAVGWLVAILIIIAFVGSVVAMLVK